MGRTRTRVDDEEALIPHNDMEEFHTSTRKKVQRRRSCWCTVKCWFALFLLLILASTAVFYFVYPSIVHENINRFIGFACSASGYAPQSNVTVTCLIMTSAGAMATKATAIDKTWASRCTAVYYFYQGGPNELATTLRNVYAVDDVTSIQPIAVALNATDATSWYLTADDGTYVSYEKLQRLLSIKQTSTGAVYVGNDITSPRVGAFVLNRAAARTILNGSKSVKTPSMIGSIRNALNVTNKDAVSGFVINNPLLTNDAQQMANMAQTCAFENVTVEQMYSFYVIGST